MAVVAVGLGLNLLVMLTNGGAMPVNPTALHAAQRYDLALGDALPFNKSRVLADQDAPLAWLGDRLVLPGPLAPIAVWSLGDVVLLAGVGRLLWQAMGWQQREGAATL
jgi:hypothetical protein